MSSIDMAQIQELKEIMEDAFGDLVTTYLNDSEHKLELLKQAIDSQQSSEIAELAHSLKGASANIYAQGMANLCMQVEDSGRAQNLSNIPSLFDDILSEFKAVKSQLQQLD